MAYSLITNDTVQGAGPITTAGVDTTGADFLVVAVACQDIWGGTPTDSKSNTWNELTSYTQTNVRVRLFWSVPTSVGTSHTFTAPADAGPDQVAGVLYMLAFSGGKQTTPNDQQNGANAFDTSLACGSITPSDDDQLIISVYGVNGTGAMPVSVDNGMTEVYETAFVAGAYGGAIAYKIQTTAAAINPTWTRSDSNGQAATVASFYAEPAAASGPANLKTIDGVVKANVKIVNSTAIASVKTINGVV